MAACWSAAATMNPVALPRPRTSHRRWQQGHSSRAKRPDASRNCTARAFDWLAFGDLVGIRMGVAWSLAQNARGIGLSLELGHVLFDLQHFGEGSVGRTLGPVGLFL